MSSIEKAESGEIAEVSALPPHQALGPSTAQFRKLGNPGPLYASLSFPSLPRIILTRDSPRGLFAFASTTLMLSFINVSARGITVANAVVGMALFVGGLAQFLAGMWEFACANTFGATGQ